MPCLYFPNLFKMPSSHNFWVAPWESKGRETNKDSMGNLDKWGMKRNSKDCFGKFSQCVICQSIHHWAKQC